jgi:tetratricopeptide (TPR) repeat protein
VRLGGDDFLVPANLSGGRISILCSFSEIELQSEIMRWRTIVLAIVLILGLREAALAQQTQGAPKAPAKSAAKPEKKAPAAQGSADSSAAPAADAAQTSPADPDAELQLAVQQAAGNNAALVKNLEAFLVKYPDSPRRTAIYRALAQSDMQAHDTKGALEYAEKVIAIQPEDSQTMYMAAMILEKMPDDGSQVHGIDYDTKLIERVAKADPESRPQQMTLDDWQAGRKKFTTELYVLRGRMERNLHKNDDAVKDLTAAFRLHPTADAAMTLGEIAEQDKHTDEAIRQYAAAFMLAGDDPDTSAATENAMRLRMGNLWRYTHNSNAGLGDMLLTAFDANKAAARAEQPEATVYNKGVSDPLQFSLRQVDGKGAVKLADDHGKVVILNFWTTWCAYCRVMETQLGEARAKFAGRDDVLTLAINADEDGALAAPFVQEQPVAGTLLFADGLDQALHVESIPTVIVLDRAGKVAYRTQGYAADGFAAAVSEAITKASAAQ